jgi:DNA-directed RNA polymerase specialized sigma24 family protein
VKVVADAGDRASEFERRLVVPEAHRLFGLALMIVDDPSEAQDLVQETFV